MGNSVFFLPETCPSELVVSELQHPAGNGCCLQSSWARCGSHPVTLLHNSFSKVVSGSAMHLNVTVGDLNILHSLTLFGMEGIEYFCQQWLVATSSFLSGRAKTSNSGFPFPAYIINMFGLSPALTPCLGCIPAGCA